MHEKLRFKKWNVYNKQIMKIWEDYNIQLDSLGQTKIFKTRKWFKTQSQEKILSDTWIEWSYETVDEHNIITKFSNPRIRDFSDFDKVLKDVQKTILNRPNIVIKNFDIKCENSYIIKN